MSITKQTYRDWQHAYSHFNKELFNGKLPECLITLQRHKGAYGYFSPKRFGSRLTGDKHVDEIAMNPQHFDSRPDRETLSTLVHEMVHLEQQHFGKPGRGRYHNAEWASWMKRIGLQPTTTGLPGGKETGDAVTHYIVDGGAYDTACAALIAKGFRIEWFDRATELASPAKGKRKSAGKGEEGETQKPGSRAKYSCPDCELNMWGKPGANVLCGDCETHMEEV